MYTGADNTEIETNSGKNDYSLNHHEPTWKVKEQRRNFRKKIFGDHYNYNYRKPNQHVLVSIMDLENVSRSVGSEHINRTRKPDTAGENSRHLQAVDGEEESSETEINLDLRNTRLRESKHCECQEQEIN